MPSVDPDERWELRQRLEHHVDDLPILPTVVGRLMVLNREDDRYFEQVVELVGSEPNFSARLLAMANSAESAPRAPITTLNAAVSRIGSLNASNIVLALAVTTVFIPRDAWEKSLWRHALQVAIAARALAIASVAGGEREVDADEVYTSALLHDLGRFVMFRDAPDQLRQIDEGDWDTPERLVEKEVEVCGLSHTDLGAIACARWGLPESIVSVVRDHHKPAEHVVSPVAKMTALIRSADLAMFPSAMPGTVGLESLDEAVIDARLRPSIPAFLKITPTQLRTLIVRAAEDAERISRAIGVA